MDLRSLRKSAVEGRGLITTFVVCGGPAPPAPAPPLPPLPADPLARMTGRDDFPPAPVDDVAYP